MSTATVRKHPHVEVRHLSPNRSSRNGAPLELIVVHATQGPNAKGLSDLIGLGDYLANPAPGGNPEAAVSVTVATDAEGNSARFVEDHDKAWHCRAFNSVSLGIEQIGFAEQTSWPEAQLRETARWIALWHRLHGIPIQHGAVSGTTVTKRGVVRHKDLGFAGGGHVDPGPHYDLAHVLELAKEFAR